MKKLLLIALAFIATTAYGQKVKLQKVTFGVVVPVSGVLTLTAPLKPLALGYNLLPNVCFITTKTYHNFLYGTGNNSLKMINGYKPKKDLGIYIALQKSLSSNSGYTGVGIEKFIPVADNVTLFLFSEVGTSLGLKSNSKLFTIGMHINIQSTVWKVKSDKKRT